MSKILFDPKIYVVSVKTGYESRQEFMNKQMNDLGLKFEYELRFDIKDDDFDDDKNYYFGLDNSKNVNAEQSLFLKHINILKQIVNKNIPMAIIFEDDAIFSDNFMSILNFCLNEYKQISQPSVISLGHGNNMYVPHSQLIKGKYLYDGVSIRCTDSYVIRHQEAKLIISYIDEYINSGNKILWPIDHFYSNVFKLIGIDFLWLHPSIVTQGSMCGMFHSELSDKRSSRSLLSNKIHYMVNVITKKLKSYFR